MAPGHEVPAPRIWGVAVTYRRPEVLDATLGRFADQTRTLDELVIVDNGSEPEVADVASRHGATYLDPGDNLGPAGGFADAMRHVLERSGDDDWILLIDDDDPPADRECLARLWDFGLTCAGADDRTAGVGNGGSRYDRTRGTFRRLDDLELSGAVPVDVLFGGSQPLYRCSAVNRVGTFDERFFWGFEEAELGLALRSAGLRLYVDGDALAATRAVRGTLGIAPGAPRTSQRKAAWRRYYSVRNSTVLAARHARPWARFFVAFGGAAKGVVALARHRRPRAEVWLPVRGAVDGLRGRLGRTVDPGSNEKAL